MITQADFIFFIMVAFVAGVAVGILGAVIWAFNSTEDCEGES